MIQAGQNITRTTIEFPSLDGIGITADLYKRDDSSRWIVLCHQSRSSRGEFREIAPRLCALGFNCLALDQRSGEEMNGVTNETVGRALERGKGVTYFDAEQDIRAAVRYAVAQSKHPIILLGSSYSASLAFKIAKNEQGIAAIAAFSPGEYFGENYSLARDVASIRLPIFLASAKDEPRSAANTIAGVPDSLKTQFIPHCQGDHGAKALLADDADAEEYWKALTVWLKKSLKQGQ